jgi:hypothetical protein
MTPARHSKGRRAGNICRYAYTLPQGGGGGEEACMYVGCRREGRDKSKLNENFVE